LNEAAAERVFMPDEPEEVRAKKSYKGRAKSPKKHPSAKRSTGQNERIRLDG